MSRLELCDPGFLVVPTIRIPIDVWQKMMGYVLSCEVEVNGLGYIDRSGGNGFVLDEVFILDQTVSALSANIDEATLHRHMHEMVAAGQDTGRLRFQWHSHVHMPARFSPTDLDTINSYGGDWVISLVANKRGEFEARLDVYRPFRVWTPIKVAIVAPTDHAATLTCIRDMAHHLRERRLFIDRPLCGDQIGGSPSEFSIPAEALVIDDGGRHEG